MSLSTTHNSKYLEFANMCNCSIQIIFRQQQIFPKIIIVLKFDNEVNFSLDVRESSTIRVAETLIGKFKF